LIRVRYGPVSLPRTLRPGHYIELKERAVNALLEASGIEGPVQEPARGRTSRHSGRRKRRRRDA
jgi:23S rRNA pseudouridine2605 synthase